MPGTAGTVCEPRIMTITSTTSTSSTASRADLLMLSAVLATCADCAAERVFLPVEDRGPQGEFCCTTCDAAVFLMPTTPHVLRRTRRAA